MHSSRRALRRARSGLRRGTFRRPSLPLALRDIRVRCAGSRAGHVTRRNATSGPRNSVNRNHVQADRLRVRAYPPATIATVNQTSPTAELPHAMPRGQHGDSSLNPSADLQIETSASGTITGFEIRSFRSGQLSGFAAADGCPGGATYGRIFAVSIGRRAPFRL